MEVWSIVGIGIVLLVGMRLVRQLGDSVPIMELMLFIAGLQWIIGPIIEYNTPSLHYRYYMYISEDIYMGFVVPAYLVFVLAVILRLKKLKNYNLPVESLQKYSNYGIIIFAIGIFFDVIGGMLPGVLKFFAFLVANFKFAGAIILYFSPKKSHKRLFYISIAYLFLRALTGALFHDFVLWSVFFYMFWALKYKPKVKTILLTFIAAGFFLITLQTIKATYRSKVWGGYSGNKVELFFGLMLNTILSNNEEEENNNTADTNMRLNQGWIISAILNNVPQVEPYAAGSTVSEAIYASALPRFLNPNKKEAGGQDNFRKFTGLQLGDGTSMGISIIGEAYGNFGIQGGVLFMGIWGLFLGWGWSRLYKIAFATPVFIAFLPLIFLQVVKAETELVVVLNHFVKASIVVFLFFWTVKRFLHWKIIE